MGLSRYKVGAALGDRNLGFVCVSPWGMVVFCLEDC